MYPHVRLSNQHRSGPCRLPWVVTLWGGGDEQTVWYPPLPMRDNIPVSLTSLHPYKIPLRYVVHGCSVRWASSNSTQMREYCDEGMPGQDGEVTVSHKSRFIQIQIQTVWGTHSSCSSLSLPSPDQVPVPTLSIPSEVSPLEFRQITFKEGCALQRRNGTQLRPPTGLL